MVDESEGLTENDLESFEVLVRVGDNVRETLLSPDHLEIDAEHV